MRSDLSPQWTKKTRSQPGEDDWLITYSDAITLILAFFVLMFSMSDMNQGKYKEVRAIIQAEFASKPTPTPFTKMANFMQTVAGKDIQAGLIEVHDSRQGLTIEFRGSALFAPGSATLKPEAKELLGKLARELDLMLEEGYQVEVQGHTDDTPIRTAQFPSNWELSTQRATNVVRFFISQGIPAERLKAVGFADTRPKYPNRTLFGKPIPENQAQNRRVVVVITRS